jgi:hypothetical protein
MAQSLDLSRTFVGLSNRGDAELIALTPSFWRQTPARKLYDRVIGIFVFRSSKDLHSMMQEVHPEADELLYVVSGAIDAVIQEGGVERTVALDAGQATIVSRGMWHRLVMRKPGKLLFINSRTGMQSRPAPNKPLQPTRAAQANRKRAPRRAARAAERRR